MWFTIIGSALLFQFSIFQMTLFNSLSHVLMQQLHLSNSQFGFIASLYFYIAAISLIPAGLLLDRYNVKRIICTIFLLNLLALIWIYFAPSILSVSMYRLLSGLSNTFAFIACMKIISKLVTGKKLNIVTSAVIAFGMLGGVLQVPFNMLMANIGWQRALLITAIIGGCYWLLMLFGIQNKLIVNGNLIKAKQHKFALTSIKNILSNAVNWQCGFYTGLLNLPVTLLAAAWGSMYLIQAKHFTSPQADLIISMIFIGMILGSPIVGWISTQILSRKMTMIVGAVLALVTILFIMMPWQFSVLQMTILFGLLGIFTTTQILSYPIVTEANALTYTGMAMSFVSALIYFVGAGCSSLFGIFASATPNTLNAAFLLVPIAFLIALSLSLFLNDSGSSQQNQVISDAYLDKIAK
jgi:MFS family permease